MAGDVRLGDLKSFLRTRREALDPESAGLPISGRRRTKGLRREEVAVLSGVSATWYTWLEQGRPVKASLGTVRRIARALRLAPADEAYLLKLAGVATAMPTEKANSHGGGEHLRAVMDGLAIPALLTGPIMEVVAYNALADALFEFNSYDGPFADSHIWRLFMDPVRQALYGDMLPEIELRTAGVFRSRYADLAGTPRFDEILAALLQASPRFAHCWGRVHTSPLDEIILHLKHRKLGPLSVATVRLAPLPLVDHLMVALPPTDAATQSTFAHWGTGG